MTDFLLKLKILYWFLANAHEQWEDEVWTRDLDENYCCDGYMCGCRGLSVRDQYNGMYRR